MLRSWFALFVLLLAACTSTPQLAPKDQPDAAAEYYAMKRATSGDPNALYAAARQEMAHMARYSTASDAIRRPGVQMQTDATGANDPFDRWQFLGPGNVGGRTRVLVIDPHDHDTMYTGGVSGGLWKTMTGGRHWEPIADALANIAINSLVMDPRDSRVLYAGTGEGYYREEVRGTALPLRGNGIFVSRDAGATWAQLPSTANENFQWVNSLVASNGRLYAATRTGVWRSSDDGATWTQTISTAVKGGCLQLVQKPDGTHDYLFASCGTFAQASVYRNKQSESGSEWEKVLSQPNQGLTTLAIAPSNPNIVYALAASNESGKLNQGLLAVFRSDQSGDAGSWQTRITNTSANIGRLLLANIWGATRTTCTPPAAEQWITMGWYCNTIAVDPRDPNIVFAGGVDILRSDDGGATWGIASYWWESNADRPAAMHADQHAIVFDPDYDGEANQRIYFLNDGGVWRTDNARAATARTDQAPCDASLSAMHFTPLNHNYGVTQFYHGSVSADGRFLLAGAQDNGTQFVEISNGPEAWHEVWGGDGGYSAFDPNDPEIRWVESQGGNVVKIAGEQVHNGTAGLNDNFLFVTPMTMDARAPHWLWIGGRSMWRRNGEQWVRASTLVNGRVSAIAVAPDDSNRVIAGTSLGDIVRTNAATSATSTTSWPVATPRSGFVTSLAYDPFDSNTVYATYAGFEGQHVWRSTDGGATWTPIDANLPAIPVHSVLVDPTRRERLYLGTDLGVFVSLDSGASWNVENSGFANVVTEWITIGQGSRGPAIYAFTHGRGAWRAELTPLPMRRRSTRH